jgi:acyl-coenzyme A synthetase/AMP-(fatty) acid ligase
MDRIPRNEMGKAMRARLRELAEQALIARQTETSCPHQLNPPPA